MQETTALVQEANKTAMSSKIEGPYGPFDFRRISLRRRPAAGRFALGIPFQ